MKNLNPLVWQHGLMAAALMIVIALVGYLMGPSVMVSAPMSVGTGGVVFAAMFLSGFAIRKDEGGFIAYKRALGHILAVTAIAIFASGLFNIVLYNYIASPEFVESMIRMVQEKTVESMSSFGAPQSMIREIEATLEEELRKGFSVAGLLQGLLWNMLMWAIPALIVALVVRRHSDVDFA
jgi:hypothetical protein